MTVNMIQQKRIRNLSLHLHGVPEGTTVVCAIHVSDRVLNRITQIGFTREFADGESVLPAIVGPITRFNAEGRWVRHRDKPKETAYRTIEWHWTEFYGDQRIERSDFKDVPYQRYPRTFLDPPSIELTLLRDSQNLQLVCASAISHSATNDAQLLHTINLFLELFEECELLNHELTAVTPPPTRRLNWHVLPPGKIPWSRLRDALAPIIERARPGSRAFIEHRFRVLHEYQPGFQAVGHAGFMGYVIFGFEHLHLYICESAQYGNATYVFAEGWEGLSQLSKAVILSGHLERARIIHLSTWEGEIRRLLRPPASGTPPAAQSLSPAS